MTQRNSRLIGGVYQVGQILTSGPFLTTYTAYNRNTSDVVGLLVSALPPTFERSEAEELLTPLVRRRQIQSPHVIRVYDWGITEGQAYIATDPPRGITLRQLLDTENLALKRAIDLATQITRGVATLQASTILDTDLRPPLITIDTIGPNDRAQVDDVGLRDLLRKLGYVQGQSMGDVEYLDPRYLTPEYIFQGSISASSDVYQLGILLFELITGRPPFVGRTPVETGTLQNSQPVPRMTQFRQDVPPVLQEIVDCALAKDPQARYPQARTLLEALEKLPLASAYRLITSGEWQAVPIPGATSGDPLSTTTKPVNQAAEAFISPEKTDVDAHKAARNLLLDSGFMLAEETRIYAYLDYEKAGEPTLRLPLKANYVIVGRHDPNRNITPEIDLTALDPQSTVSRQHARIRFEKTFFSIEDLKSRNQTRLNERALSPMKPELLRDGDVVRFGSVRMVFRVSNMGHDIPTSNNLP